MPPPTRLRRRTADDRGEGGRRGPLQVEGTRCVFGVPGAQNNELWDAMKAYGLPYLLVTHEASASVMADASRAGHGPRRRLRRRPGPGPDQRPDRHRRGALRQRADRRHRHRHRPQPRRPGRPGPRPAQRRPAASGLQGGASRSGTRPQIPGAIHQAFRIARCGEPGPVAVVIPYPLYNEVWDYDEPPPPPPAPPLRRGGLPTRPRPARRPHGTGSASTPGWAAWTPGRR